MKASILSLFSLLGFALAQSCPDGGATGFASAAGGTTGGGNAQQTIVTTLEQFKNAAKDSAPRVIVIQGTIDTAGAAISIASDKTIIGVNADATIVGGITMDRVDNIIIKNVKIKAGSNGPADTIASKYSHHIWYDHLEVWDASDGLIDITRESDYQTVSWCKFWYSNTQNDHRLASLIGAGGGTQPNDEGKLHVSFHHNWWSTNVDQRMPRVMYGEGHIYNNFFNSPGNSYCIGFGSYGSVLIENNYFKDVKNPHQFMYAVYAYAAASGNVYDNTSGKKDAGYLGSEDVAGQEWATADPVKPPYQYALVSASSVPDLIKSCAGPRSSPGSVTSLAPIAATSTTVSMSTKSTTSIATTTTSSGNDCSPMWGQCGGIGWTGPTCCVSGSTCKSSNDWYSQCL